MMTTPWMLLVLAAAPRVLTLQQALDTADARQPSLVAERANVDVLYARSDEARSTFLPQITLNGTRAWLTANVAPSPGAYPGSTRLTPLPESHTLFNSYSAVATGNQLLFDFGQSLLHWRATRSIAEAEVSNARELLLSVRLNVRAAYFNARAQKSLVDVAQTTLANEQKHLAQTQGFVQVGTQPEIALAQEKATVANDRLLLIQAENNYATSKAQLNQAMGVEQSTDYDVEDTPPEPVTGEGKDVGELMQEALSTRPEFAALERQVHAQELAVWSTRGAYLPTLSAQVGFSERGTQLNNLVWNYYGELLLSWPIFQGLLTYSQDREQMASLRQVEANRDVVRLQVRLELEQAWLAVRAAVSEQDAANEALENAQEQLHLAEGRYQTGVGSIIELGDAQVRATNAAAQKVKSEYDLNSARAQLLKALGRD